jgi:hypothetical protein
MNRIACLLTILGTIVACSLPAAAQQKRVSPHETVGTVINNDRITVVYGRPFIIKPGTTEVRKIWGKLVPFGEIWRTGADEATLFITEVPIVMGGVTIPAGAYSLWTLPNADGTAKLIINKQVGQWGVNEQGWHNVYDQANDVVRADLTKSDLADTVDQFTISIEKDPATPGGGLIKLKWEKTQFAVAFGVPK